MKQGWIFIRKFDGVVIQAELYGSLRKLSQNREIVISGNQKTEGALRYLFKDRDEYQDENYYIAKRKVKRLTRNN